MTAPGVSGTPPLRVRIDELILDGVPSELAALLRTPAGARRLAAAVEASIADRLSGTAGLSGHADTAHSRAVRRGGDDALAGLAESLAGRVLHAVRADGGAP